MHRRIQKLLSLVFVVTLLQIFAPASSGAGTPERLVHPAHVHTMEVSNNSQYMVYMADDGLFSYNFINHTSVKLNSAGGDFKISPDSRRVVYGGVLSGQTTPQLYSVPIGGGTSTQINTTLAGSLRVQSFQTSADSMRVIYMVRDINNTAAPGSIYSVPLAGGATPVQLATDLPAMNVSALLSPNNSSRMLLIAQPKADPQANYSLYSAPMAGGPSTLLAANVPELHVDGVSLPGDGNRVVYLRTGDQNRRELYTVPVAGGTPSKISLPANGSVYMNRYVFSANGQAVAFLSSDGTPAGDGVYATTLASNQLSPKLNNDGSTLGHVRLFKLTPDGSRVVYQRNTSTASMSYPADLISSVVTTGITATLNRPGSADWGGVETFEISPDSQFVAYIANQIDGPSDGRHVYSVAVSGGTSTALSNPPEPRYGRYPDQSLMFSKDSAFVFFRAESYFDSRFDLYRAPAAGGSPAEKINTTVASVGEWPNADYYNYRVTNNGKYVVFRGGTIADISQPLALYVDDQDVTIYSVYVPVIVR